LVFASRGKGGFKLKQQLVSIIKEKSKNCGFGLCPKKYKYLANPELLAEIFTVSNSVGQKTAQVKVSKHRGPDDSPLDSIRSAKCIGCNQKYLLRVANPICITCRGMI
jgi:hypothetical protein